MIKTMIVKVQRNKLYNVRSCPGPQWRWSYTYVIDNGPLCQYGTGLTELRSLLRRKYPDATIVESWK